MLTKKDYEIVAIAVAQALSEARAEERAGIKKVIEHLCHAFQIDNPRFQPAKFIKFIEKSWKESDVG